MPISPADFGDLVPLGQALMSMTWWGYVTDIDTPSGVWATLEAVGDEAFVTMDVIKGDPGPKGDNAPLVEIIWDPDVEEVADLPAATTTNRNKGYWIGDLVYISTGSLWKPKRPGPAGARGPAPDITVSAETLTWEDQVLGFLAEASITGSDENPNIHFTVPQGPPGPPGESSSIRDSEDYSEPLEIQNGDVPIWNAGDEKYQPGKLELKNPRWFTVPEGSFTNFSGVATRQQVMVYDIPPQTRAFFVKVNGHLQVTGVDADSEPMIVGAEVRLGDPTTGQLVARGKGNSSTIVNMSPHFSEPSGSMAAVNPDGDIGKVPAGHSGDVGKLYCNLINEGVMGTYMFNKQSAQLDVELIYV
jgi:hypothetical protein